VRKDEACLTEIREQIAQVRQLLEQAGIKRKDRPQKTVFLYIRIACSNLLRDKIRM